MTAPATATVPRRRRASLPRVDVLLALMGTPHRDDTTTYALRLAESLLSRRADVGIWTCGYATMLTQLSLGTDKPRDLSNWSAEHASTAGVATMLLHRHAGHLHWYACRFCSDDRGATEHVPGVILRAPAKYAENIAAANRTITIGTI